MLAETYTELITNAAHWGFEITVEIITGVLIAPFVRMIYRRALRRHDREVHHV